MTSTTLLYFLKDTFRRHRPMDPLITNVTGFSFPSGHSFSSFTFCGLIVYLLWQSKIGRGWKVGATIFFFLFATTIAFSRVYLRVHFPSDVIAGFCLSMMWLLLSIWVLHIVDKKIFRNISQDVKTK
ncbi:MAG: phosphatase PAP2 family protein [Ginsengibacter sp.]